MSRDTQDIYERLNRLMETDKIQEFVTYQLEHTFAPIRQEFKKDFLSLETEFLNFKDQFAIPGLIGEKTTYSDISSFLKGTYEGTNFRIETQAAKIKDIEDK